MKIPFFFHLIPSPPTKTFLKERVMYRVLVECLVSTYGQELVGNAIDSGMGLSITIDKLRVFINKTLSILSAYQ